MEVKAVVGWLSKFIFCGSKIISVVAVSIWFAITIYFCVKGIFFIICNSNACMECIRGHFSNEKVDAKWHKSNTINA